MKIIIILFFILRIAYMITLPLFTDESSSIRWGQYMVQSQQNMWSSFGYTGKPPLILWLFGWAVHFTGSTIIAPRLVSIMIGLIFIISLYHWIKQLHSQRAATIAVGIVAISPLFVHFQTLAFAESLVLLDTLLLVWFSTTGMIPQLGLAIALGFWTKTNMLIPILLSLITVKKKCIWPVLIAIPLILPVILNPDFRKIASDSGNFTFSIAQLTQFPLTSWAQNIFHAFVSLLIYCGPVLIFIFLRLHTKYRILLIWSAVLITGPLLINKIMSTRYYMNAVIPLLPIISMYISEKFQSKYGKPLIISSCAITLALSIVLVSSPRTFFSFIPLQSERNYAFSWTAGYSSHMADTYVRAHIPPNGIFTVPDYTGNPSEYFISRYFADPKYIFTFLTVAEDLPRFSKIPKEIPLYFITRSTIPLGNLKPHLELIKSFNTDATDEVSIYRIIRDPT